MREDELLMKQCVKDAKAFMESEGMVEYQTDIINLARAFFDYRIRLIEKDSITYKGYTITKKELDRLIAEKLTLEEL